MIVVAKISFFAKIQKVFDIYCKKLSKQNKIRIFAIQNPKIQ